MNSTSWETRFSKIMEEHKHSLYEICKASMECILENSETARQGFQFFLTQARMPQFGQDEIPEELFDVAENEIDRPTQKRLRDMENQVVKGLILQDVPEDEFYDELWARLNDTILISDIDQKSYFLRQMWLDQRIPYFRLGPGISMDNETYGKYVKRLETPYKKMRFALHANYSQRTQKASILMQIADDIPDEEERIVFWSLVLAHLENQITRWKQIAFSMEHDDSDPE
jgi:hypothetical protein